MTQDLPISKPYTPGEIEELVAGKQSGACPFYVDLMPVAERLLATAERMRSLGGEVVLGVAKVCRPCLRRPVACACMQPSPS